VDLPQAWKQAADARLRQPVLSDERGWVERDGGEIERIDRIVVGIERLPLAQKLVGIGIERKRVLLGRVDIGYVDPLSREAELVLVAPASPDTLIFAGLVNGGERRHLVVVEAVRVLEAEGALAARRAVVAEVTVVREVVVLVARAKHKHVALDPWVRRVSRIADVDWLGTVVAHRCQKGKQAAPAELGD